MGVAPVRCHSARPSPSISNRAFWARDLGCRIVCGARRGRRHWLRHCLAHMRSVRGIVGEEIALAAPGKSQQADQPRKHRSAFPMWERPCRPAVKTSNCQGLGEGYQMRMLQPWKEQQTHRDMGRKGVLGQEQHIDGAGGARATASRRGRTMRPRFGDGKTAGPQTAPRRISSPRRSTRPLRSRSAGQGRGCRFFNIGSDSGSIEPCAAGSGLTMAERKLTPQPTQQARLMPQLFGFAALDRRCYDVAWGMWR